MTTSKDAKKQLLTERIRAFCCSQRFAVLATASDSQPYTTLVSFAESPDLRRLFFATKRNTQKYMNLRKNQRVALLIDNRQNNQSDLAYAITITALGIAQEETMQVESVKALLRSRHPTLNGFLADPTCAVFAIIVDVYQVVERFEQVQVLSMRDPLCH